MTVMDKINNEYGRTTITLTALDLDKKNGICAKNIFLGAYTTSWDELAEVR